jgi:hypothetical protein
MYEKSSKDRSSLCVFTFADGRHCTLPESPEDMGLCYYHSRKFVDKKRARMAGRHIAQLLNADITTACDLNAVFNSLFSAAAQGYIKPKAAAALAYIGQLMLQSHGLAKAEFLEASAEKWADVVRESPAFTAHHPLPPPPQDRFEPEDDFNDLEEESTQTNHQTAHATPAK